MKVSINSKFEQLPIKIYIYNTFVKRLKGLMFRINPIVNEGILIIPCNSIHMFFMFFSIDVIFLNQKNEIIYLKENVKPWTVIFPIKNATAALELPAGSIAKYSITIGATIEI